MLLYHGTEPEADDDDDDTVSFNNSCSFSVDVSSFSTEPMVRRSKRKRSLVYSSSSEYITSTSEVNSEVKEEKKQYDCSWCFKSFPFQSVLMAHTRIHTGEKPYKCSHCDRLFAQKGSLLVHERRHTGDKPFQCAFCPKTFASQGNMKIHERRHTGDKPYACSTCNKNVSTIGALRAHEISHSNVKRFDCDVCQKRFSHRSSLYAHKKLHQLSSLDTTRTPNCNSELSESQSSDLNTGTPPKIEQSQSTKAKRWACQYCGKLFAFRHPMVAHERIHTGERPFTCNFCDKAFCQQTSLIMHERSHRNERRYACTVCGKRFIQQGALNAHMRTHTGEKPFQCSICQKRFGHATSLRQHQLRHVKRESGLVENGPNVSDYISGLVDNADPTTQRSDQRAQRRRSAAKHNCFCGKSFAFLSILESHMRTHTGERPFKCSNCPKTFAQKATLHVHERIHTGERPYKCRFCDSTFAQYGTKTIHEKSHLGIRSYKCSLCNKHLSSPSALYTHKRTHGERNLQCKQCDKAFTLPNYLKLHIKSIHGDLKKNHSCQFCGKNFANAGSLQVHIRIHTGERPFACRFCTKAFASQGNMMSHERIHTGEKPFVCQECGHACAQRSQLVSHKNKYHTNGQPDKTTRQSSSRRGEYACKYCDKKFAYASSLYVHNRLHTGQRPYSCSYCSKTFTNQGNKQAHERVHTGERPFKCPACDKSYVQKVGLKIHLEQCEYFTLFRQSSMELASLSSDQILNLLRPTVAAVEESLTVDCDQLDERFNEGDQQLFLDTMIDDESMLESDQYFKSEPSTSGYTEQNQPEASIMSSKLAKQRRLETLLPKLRGNNERTSTEQDIVILTPNDDFVDQTEDDIKPIVEDVNCNSNFIDQSSSVVQNGFLTNFVESFGQPAFSALLLDQSDCIKSEVDLFIQDEGNDSNDSITFNNYNNNNCS